MTRRNFVLSNGASPAAAPLEDLKKIAEILEADGAIQVAYSLELTTAPMPSPAVNDLNQKKVEASVETLLRRIRPFGVVADMGEPIVVKAGEDQAEVDVHVLLESDVIRFTEAPWHSDNLSGGKEFPRLLDALKRGRRFWAHYEFREPEGEFSKPYVVNRVLNTVYDHGYLPRLWLVRWEWPYQTGKCRIDIRIEPKTEAVVAPPTSGAPPYCDQCGQLTVIRNGIFKCPSCGNEMRPK